MARRTTPPPPFRTPHDGNLTRIVESVRSVLDPDAVELEVVFHPQGLRYRRRFFRQRVSAARAVRGPARPVDPVRHLELPFCCSALVDGTLVLLRRAMRPWTGPERLRFELLSPFLAQLLELSARWEMDGHIVRPEGPLYPADLRPHLSALGLSAREVEVVTALLRGLRNAEIARELFITEWTVKDHLKHVFAKLGVRSRGGVLKTLLDETLLS
ncbi:MAG: LuxR C-terminal-related transcriptional regulator [Thermoanaerobaculia bacterium]